ncbi:MAG: thiosulfate oxidation carrier protein SoxY [Beijerinckiaceae bacterium]
MSDDASFAKPTRRRVITAGAGLAALALAPTARATPQEMEKAILAFTGGVKPKEGRVTVDIPVLLESGASVPTKVSVESAMRGDDFVSSIAVFNERNPQPNVAVFQFSARSGKALAQTRIRLGDSQKIVAVAKMRDGSFYMGSIEVIVTLPACAEDA